MRAKWRKKRVRRLKRKRRKTRARSDESQNMNETEGFQAIYSLSIANSHSLLGFMGCLF
ncbi:hypothetical protein H101_01857 [Trichophyton interdigitale H6]|nr:hypothetical protein H101_01857 [Trichophyton interdigitale H6]